MFVSFLVDLFFTKVSVVHKSNRNDIFKKKLQANTRGQRMTELLNVKEILNEKIALFYISPCNYLHDLVCFVFLELGNFLWRIEFNELIEDVKCPTNNLLTFDLICGIGIFVPICNGISRFYQIQLLSQTLPKLCHG